MTEHGSNSQDLSEERVIEITEGNRYEYPDSAVYCLEEYIAANPVALRARLCLASLYADEHGLGAAGAERLLREILQDYPGTLSAMTGLALLQGHPHSNVTADESVELLHRVALRSKDPNDARNYANKAWDVARFEEAVTAFEWLMSLATGARAAYFRKIAVRSIDAIRSGRRPTSFIYVWEWDPESHH